MYQHQDITIALTSCGRINLLRKTIESLSKSINLSQYPRIMTEDTRDLDIIKKIKYENKYGFLQGWDIIFTLGSKQNTVFKSHYQALKKLYNSIKTSYVFHCEDDRYFSKQENDFIYSAKKILENNPTIGIIGYRNFWRKSIYNFFSSSDKITKSLFLPYLKKDNNFSYLLYAYDDEIISSQSQYNGFTLNPGLRRTKEMKSIMFGYEDFVDEIAIGKRYKNFGLRSINLNPPISHHIGDHIYSTYFFKDGFLKSVFRSIKNAWKLYFT